MPNTLRSLGLVLMTPPGLSGSPSQVAFSEDGQTLIAAVKGFPTTTPGEEIFFTLQGFIKILIIIQDSSLHGQSRATALYPLSP